MWNEGEPSDETMYHKDLNRKEKKPSLGSVFPQTFDFMGTLKYENFEFKKKILVLKV